MEYKLVQAQETDGVSKMKQFRVQRGTDTPEHEY